MILAISAWGQFLPKETVINAEGIFVDNDYDDAPECTIYHQELLPLNYCNT